MIFPQADQTLLRLYRCGVCSKVYAAQPGPGMIRCAVNHAPGSCCHYFEAPYTEASAQTILALAKDLAHEADAG